MSQFNWKQPCIVWCLWLLVALLVNLGPSSIFSRVEKIVLDIAGVSLKLIDDASMLRKPSESRPTQLVHGKGRIDRDSVDAEIITLRNQNRDLSALIATLQSENSRLKAIPDLPFDVSQSQLQSISAVPANVIGRVTEEMGEQNQLLITLGERHGLVGHELILKGDGILIDQGEYENLSADQLVTFGRSLYGKTIRIGKWTSLIQPVTDLRFQTAVQLIRHSEFGMVTGASGILKGTGDGCEIYEVAGTEAVAVGDLVYTDPTVSPTGTPIYCGRVVEASISPNAAHWTIKVEPATSSHSIPNQLTVIRTQLNLGSNGF